MVDHPVNVPPELFAKWLSEAMRQRDELNAQPGTVAAVVADRAAQWGADQELEASVNWLIENQNQRWAHALRAARRPKPPTLAEQGMEALSAVVDVLRLGFPGASVDGLHIQALTTALNRLAELEAQQ